MRYFSKNSISNRRLAVCLLAVISVSVSGCNEDDKQSVSGRNWDLVWSDEFDGAAGELPDASKWGFDLGNNGGWGNQELENYTNDPENVSLDGNGNLVITAIKAGNSYTSARIKTQTLFSQKYGRFEARLKTPYGPGIWPAFWMLGANVGEVGWPQCGEIDIMELKGQQPNIIHGTVHGPGYSAGGAISSSYALQNSRFDLEYHVFAVEWSENKIDFFCDDFLYKRITKSDVPGQWVYDHDFYMILNIAVGGNYAGFPTSQTPFPQKMIVDYVKVYQ
ncbi:glycoside hydrolase family 16 protein [Flavobacterium sp. MAH-1]|uniref:Glycoside hydrolase family 16 protein n=1 Tax=Flavobacterium agri TaxID=2743471 RepID=A0A7Y8Y123_9FLAO|nr:glycoside hydrolase family 16 protein [Flavobacterium agri]NUY80440.1 glycoside hydrolase family 16 protein [Flavobacterium agri]NYA70465.1 glycoside hydrolase family 16 protein [Flavobacterium agri]